MTAPVPENLKGGEMITATITLSRDQWAIVCLLIRSAMPQLPMQIWKTSDYIADTVEAAINEAD